MRQRVNSLCTRTWSLIALSPVHKRQRSTSGNFRSTYRSFRLTDFIKLFVNWALVALHKCPVLLQDYIGSNTKKQWLYTHTPFIIIFCYLWKCELAASSAAATPGALSCEVAVRQVVAQRGKFGIYYHGLSWVFSPNSKIISFFFFGENRFKQGSIGIRL